MVVALSSSIAALGIASDKKASDKWVQSLGTTESGEPQDAEGYWREVRTDLFVDIELRADQEAGIEAILAEAAAGRARFAEVQTDLARARENGDTNLVRNLAQELGKIQKTFQPNSRIDRMGELLDAEQREIFDRNLRQYEDRQLAKRWARKDKEKAERQRARKPRAPEASVE